MLKFLVETFNQHCINAQAFTHDPNPGHAHMLFSLPLCFVDASTHVAPGMMAIGQATIAKDTIVKPMHIDVEQMPMTKGWEYGFWFDCPGLHT